MFTINWTNTAARQLAKIASTDRRRITSAVTMLEDLPNARNVKALKQHQYGYRLRVGPYRVLFDADTTIRIVDIQQVKKRDDTTY